MAKGRRQPMYTPQQQANYRRCPCDPVVVINDDEVERQLEQKLTGGFKRNNICPTCRIARSVNGSCACY